MFARIMIPTDGSTLSLKAARTGAALAQKLGATVTAIYVLPPYTAIYAGDGLVFSSPLSEKEYLNSMRAHAAKMLGRVEALVAKHGMTCTPETIVAPTPWEGILKGASKLKCDLIVMASHGRTGLASVVLGSQTTRVLTHSKIPVLVCR